MKQWLAFLVLFKANKWLAGLALLALIVALVVWYSLAPYTRATLVHSLIGGLVGGAIVAWRRR